MIEIARQEGENWDVEAVKWFHVCVESGFFFSIWYTLEVVDFGNISLQYRANHIVFFLSFSLAWSYCSWPSVLFFFSLQNAFYYEIVNILFPILQWKSFLLLLFFPIFVNGKEYESQMIINVIQKKLGSRKELGKRLVTLAEQPLTLSDLLFELTRQGLTTAQEQVENVALSDSEIAEQAVEGRVKFAESYGMNNDTLDKAKQHTWQAFKDGLFRVFINREEITSWDAPLSLPEGAEVVFLQLTMLTGLYF